MRSGSASQNGFDVKLSLEIITAVLACMAFVIFTADFTVTYMEIVMFSITYNISNAGIFAILAAFIWGTRLTYTRVGSLESDTTEAHDDINATSGFVTARRVFFAIGFTSYLVAIYIVFITV